VAWTQRPVEDDASSDLPHTKEKPGSRRLGLSLAAEKLLSTLEQTQQQLKQNQQSQALEAKEIGKGDVTELEASTRTSPILGNKAAAILTSKRKNKVRIYH
jgi:hypothetical protein